MKHLTLIFALLTSLFLTSCSDSSSPSGGDTSGTIIGTWNLVFLEYDGETTITDTEDGSVMVQQVSGEGENFDFQITYEENSTFSSSGTYELIITSEINGQSIRDTLKVDDDHNSGEYLFDGTTLTAYDSSGVETKATVIMLTEDMMIYKFNRKERRNFGSLIFDEDYDHEYRFVR